jgi:tetratricopeptide (TPR) repeat protein/tRNA A-37 threonylcarbamoyl transferase component Bud32
MSTDERLVGGVGVRGVRLGATRGSQATLDWETGDPWRLPPSSASADPRVAAALEEYLAAVEAGSPPSREDFLERHAAIAEALGECLSGLEFVRAVSWRFDEAGSGDASCRGDAPAMPAARLGDYRILREVGRGSMGVVYESEQISLGRRVALKVLPFASAIDPRQRQRFLIEAQAAAQLHHPHIVPVFAADSDRGVYFYAMQFVDGRTLAELVGEMRRRDAETGGRDEDRPGRTARDDFRTIARLGVQAAEALEHAHSLGVVHRDVKPANLMVDSRGELWITDFGLARTRGDASLTRSGDLVGTLRYMSPEQALARRGVVDQRTDIYALGLTLYELLTLRPAFDGREHHELLRQIATDEPVPPRRIDPTIPRDLETIVMKAACKEPSGRYATAQELADDLSRFREDRPILARRPTVLERGVRWARRHRQIVVTAATVLVLALACGAAAVSVQARKTEAMRQDLLGYILKSFPAIDTITITAMQQATESAMGSAQDDKQVQMHEVYEKALDFYTLAAALPPTDLASRTIIARAHYRVGFTNAVMSRTFGMSGVANPKHLAEAEDHYRDATARFERLLAEAPRDVEVRRQFAQALGEWGLGWYLAMTDRPGQAEPHYRRAFELRRELVLDPRAEASIVAEELTRLAQLSHTLAGHLEARGGNGEADVVRGDLAATCATLAGREPDSKIRAAIALPLGRYGLQLMGENRREGAEILGMAVVIDPDNAGSLNNLAWVLASVPDVTPKDAERAVEAARKAVSIWSEMWGYWNTLGVAAYRAGDLKMAEEALEKSMSLNKGGQAVDWFFLAMIRQRQGRPDEARRWFDRAVSWTREKQPQNPELRRFQAEAEELLGLARKPPGPGPAPHG